MIGDSGGPISQVSGTLYGLVSWGVKCAFKTYPGVYTGSDFLSFFSVLPFFCSFINFFVSLLDISIYSRWIDYVLTL